MNEHLPNLLETPDAGLWATTFKQAFPTSNVDEGTMIGWFANAMMCMHDWKERRMMREEGEGAAGSHITQTNRVVPHELEGLSDEMKTRMCHSVVSAPYGFSFKQIEWLDENLSQPYVRTSHRCYFLDSDDMILFLTAFRG